MVNKDKVYVVLGFATYKTCLVVHDGKTDFFKTMPPHVRKNFPSTSAIRDFMQADESSKVFAVVMEGFEGRGPYRYELSNNRFRVGYGKTNLKGVQAEGLSESAAKFFGSKKHEPSDTWFQLMSTKELYAIDLENLIHHNKGLRPEVIHCETNLGICCRSRR